MLKGLKSFVKNVVKGMRTEETGYVDNLGIRHTFITTANGITEILSKGEIIITKVETTLN